MIAHPDGALGPVPGVAAPARGAARRDDRAARHGPELPDAPTVARQYLAHREERLEQVRAALRVLGDAATAREVVERVYADVDRVLWPAAEASVRAQLAYLRAGRGSA